MCNKKCGKMWNVICFDLEGPLSPQDNAYEVMGIIENGHKIFEIISRYDDLLALEGRENYEPGDTLALIAPFLVYHKITEQDIKKISDKAILVNGAKELISKLKKKDWKIYIISTSYEQHAYNIGSKLGIGKENIICTSFPLNKYIREFEKEDFYLIEKIEKEILKIAIDDKGIKNLLDKFYWEDLPKKRLGNVIKKMKVVGGKRKVDAVIEIARKLNKRMEEIVVVGDSITDFKMLKTINEKNGLSIVFNGNIYAIPYATIALATTNMEDLMYIIELWEKGGRDLVIKKIKEFEEVAKAHEPFFHLLIDKKNFDDIVKIHRIFRNKVRGKAGRLG